MVVFARWVMYFCNEDSAWGDVARDIMVDPRVTTRMGYRALRDCIAAQSPEPVVLAIIDEMWAAYKARPLFQ